MRRASQKIAFQGERGAFSEVAVRQLAGEDAVVLPCSRFQEVFESVIRGTAKAAVIPIENTLHGSVHENYDHLLHYELAIAGETDVRIVHNLIAPPGVKFAQVRRVLSHPVALNQCLDFFAAHPQIERVLHYDTAGSVKTVVEEGWTDAAGIAAAVAADIYGAKILKKSIEDDRENFTRFFLLVPQKARKQYRPPAEPCDWKTSIVFTTKNLPGALFRCMSVFALRDISLSKIESRPLRGKPYEYLFYLDFLGRLEEERCAKALGHLAELADFLRVLGSYARGC